MRWLAVCLLFWTTRHLGQAASPTFTDPMEVGVVQKSPLKESSGVAASRVHSGVLYTHNDGATQPTLVAIDTAAHYLGTFKLPDFPSGDFEDIAVGPGPDPQLSYVYLGDIGDNRVNRADIVVYQIAEPWVDLRWADQPASVDLDSGHAFHLQYPDEPHDSEALLVDPLRRELFVITKEPGVAKVYKISIDQMNPGDINLLEWVLDVPFHMASAGDISPDGTQILLRNEDYGQWWSRPMEWSIEEALMGEPSSVPLVRRPIEPNGEAIGFSQDGNGYYTLSDDSDPPTLYYIGRALPPYGLVPEELVSPGSLWRYLDTGANLAAAWHQAEYPDEAWKRGAGAFGYGDDRLQTTVSYGSSSKKKHITTYFRMRFTVLSMADLQAAEIRYLVDDGCAVYLNGVEVVRANLASGAAFDTLATAEQKEFESSWFKAPLELSRLRLGINTLAVEVHQHSTDSKDLRFDLQLVVRRDPRPRVMGLMATGSNRILQLRIPTLERVMVQSSENLRDWEDWSLVEPFEILTSVTDLRPPKSGRFYRLIPTAE